MPLFRVSLRFASDISGHPPRKWSNTLFANDATPLAAASRGVSLWTGALRSGARERVWCYQVYATDLAPLTDNYHVYDVEPGAQRGSLPTPAGEPYLPKACVAVALPVSGSRPSRKFWRPGLYEGDVTNGVTLSVSLADAIRDAWGTGLAADEGYWLDPDGEQYGFLPQLRLTTREYGREATANVPVPPALA